MISTQIILYDNTGLQPALLSEQELLDLLDYLHSTLQKIIMVQKVP
jgi:hypothetical protein